MVSPSPAGLSVTVTAAIAGCLRDAIRSGRFAPGQPLRQTSIAREFNVSTTPVREAFMVLEREGFVIRHDRRGVVVFDPTVEDLREIFLIRIPLETLATETAVPNLTAKEIETLEQLVDAGQHAQGQQDVDGSLMIGDAFHSTLYRVSRLPRLVAMIDSLVAASASYIKLTEASASPRREIDGAHRAILDACKARDAPRAAEAMQHHLRTALEVLSVAVATRRADHR